MPQFRVTIHVFRKPAVLNPEEGPIKAALSRLGFKTISNFKKGSCMVVELEADDDSSARGEAKRMCVDGKNYCLVNPVTESYDIFEVKQIAR